MLLLQQSALHYHLSTELLCNVGVVTSDAIVSIFACITSAFGLLPRAPPLRFKSDCSALRCCILVAQATASWRHNHVFSINVHVLCLIVSQAFSSSICQSLETHSRGMRITCFILPSALSFHLICFSSRAFSSPNRVSFRRLRQTNDIRR